MKAKTAALALLITGCASSAHQSPIASVRIASPSKALHTHDDSGPDTTTTSTTSTTSTTEAPSPPPTEAPKAVYAPPSTEAPQPVYVAPEPTYAPRQQAAASGGRVVSSTAYCDHGTTASGEQTHSGGVAMNSAPMGSRWTVVETGATYYVNDRIGSGSDFDIWMSSCGDANNYGRQTLHLVPAS